jgi:hypothetical protein
MKPTWCILIVVLANVAMAAAPGVMDFSSGQPADYFSDDTAGRVQISSIGDTQVMVISDATARFHDMKVKPSVKYTLTLEAAFGGDVESIEENPRFEIFTRPGQASTHLPSREIRFFDAAGKPTGRSMVYAMPFKNRRTYQDIFHTPADAISARISLASGKGVRLVLSQLSLAETDDEAVLNVNPTFQLGPYNYSGWQSISAGGQLIEREGKTILDTKYGSTGQMIPLSEPGTYAFSAKATANGYNSVVIVRVYDALGKELMRSSTRRYGPRTYFVPPKNAAYASFLVYSCLLEEVRLLRVGNERAIESLQGDP